MPNVATKYFSIQVMVFLLYKVAASNAEVQKYVMKFLITELHVWFFAMLGDFSWSMVLEWCVHLSSDQQSVLMYAKVGILYIISDIRIWNLYSKHIGYLDLWK